MNAPVRSIYFIGLGAIGTKYAARLHDAFPGAVKIVADEKRIVRFEETPPTVNGKTYRFDFIRSGEPAPPADVFFVALKFNHLLSALEEIKPLVGPHTSVLSLMNGISSEEIIGRHVGADRMLYANVYMDAVRTGAAVTYRDIGKIVFGERVNAELSPRVAAIRDLFDAASIPYEIPKDMERAHWAKFMLNVGVNQASAVLRAPYGAFQHEGPARELMLSAAREVVAISQAANVGLDETNLETLLRVIDSLDPAGKTSMLQDVEAGRETEVDIFAGAVCELGERYGVATPVNDVLYQLLKGSR